MDDAERLVDEAYVGLSACPSPRERLELIEIVRAWIALDGVAAAKEKIQARLRGGENWRN